MSATASQLTFVAATIRSKRIRPLLEALAVGRQPAETSIDGTPIGLPNDDRSVWRIQ